MHGISGSLRIPRGTPFAKLIRRDERGLRQVVVGYEPKGSHGTINPATNLCGALARRISFHVRLAYVGRQV